MARHHPKRPKPPARDVAVIFRDTCLIGDGSLFSAGRALWTKALAGELRRPVLDHPGQGSGDFVPELEARLSNASADVKCLAAEMLWSLLRTQSALPAARKREVVTTVWGWAGEALEKGHPLLADAVLEGTGSAGLVRTSGQWQELGYLVQLVDTLKDIPTASRAALVRDPRVFGG
ncbi:MAG: hypothetical protein Q8Q88_19610 [Phenylobacterium sp.]|uniref:hypothetical protein n=1 Tax=Phenylobacterium sp. TaxID=1871053 RepID=UPI002734CB05|nr:hypothetical protein [Phenylobacterium sp.]MDP3749249.1 hypothetical protein [Phenylobacterium sp.]